MDKRDLSAMFRKRLRKLLDSDDRSKAQFLADTGLDRSALSQFLDPSLVRLPRAETLRQIAVARGVSVDWLLGMENAPEGRTSLSSSFQIEHEGADGTSPLDQWREQVAGQKLRYVPSLLPDMLDLHGERRSGAEGADLHGASSEIVLDGLIPGDLDIEIAMPVQTLQCLARQTGHFDGIPRDRCRDQLVHMARICAGAYPALRLHLFDGRDLYSAPFTVYGKQRVAIYIGASYLVLTNEQEIRAFVRRFDDLVRRSVVGPDLTAGYLDEIAKQM